MSTLQGYGRLTKATSMHRGCSPRLAMYSARDIFGAAFVLLVFFFSADTRAGGLIEVRREPKFVYHNGFASSYSDIDHDDAGTAFGYGQQFHDFCYMGTCYYTENLRPQPSNQPFGFSYNGKPYMYVSDRRICQGDVCTTYVGSGMTITMKILCDTTNGWGAKPTNTDQINRKIACVKHVREDELTCRDPRFGNPLIPGLGIKYQAEVDYQFPQGPFAFARIYRSDRGWTDSATGSRLLDYSGVLADAATCTSGTYDRKVNPTGPLQKIPYCFPLIGVGVAEYDLQTTDGRLIRFTGSASNPSPKADVSTLLTQRVVNGLIEWVMVDDSNRLTVYSGEGLPRSTTKPDGRFVTYVFANGTTPGEKVLSSVTEWTGRQINFAYDAARRLTSMRIPDGQVLTYGYDDTTSFCSSAGACNNLTSVTYPGGTTRRFHYNESQFTANANIPRLLTGVTDEAGTRYATFSYDSTGRAIGTQHAGDVDTYSMSSNAGWARVTDARGSVYTMSFTSTPTGQRLTHLSQPAGSGCGPSSSAITYDANANISSRTDFNGSKTCYAYDLSRNLETKRAEGLTSSADCNFALSSPPAGARLISTQWHPDWRLETRIAEPKKLTTIVYNGQGATCAPDTVLVDGKPPAVVCSRTEQATTDETGAAGFAAAVTGTARTWSYTYTTYGRVLTATDPNGAVTSYTYHPDNDANLGRRGNVASITNAVGHVTRITAYNAHGQPTRIIDPNNLVTDLTYDLRMRLTRRKVGSETTSFVYDAAGQLTRVTLPDGARLTYTYDAAHRLTAIQDHKGNKVAYTLDAMGNRINEKLTDPGGVLVRNIQRSIDALNRVQQVTGAVHQTY